MNLSIYDRYFASNRQYVRKAQKSLNKKRAQLKRAEDKALDEAEDTKDGEWTTNR